MTDNPNTNCLAGFQCPECGSYGPFTVAVHGYMTLHDSGAWDVENPSYEDDDACFCEGCDFHGQLADFTQEADQ